LAPEGGGGTQKSVLSVRAQELYQGRENKVKLVRYTDYDSCHEWHIFRRILVIWDKRVGWGWSVGIDEGVFYINAHRLLIAI
jgi:hypothetical protein